MKRLTTFALLCAVTTIAPALAAEEHHAAAEKPGPDDVMEMLKEGNAQFVKGEAKLPHADKSRRELAGSSDQANFAYATILSCSDSRVPVELIFNAGVMDLFVIRVAGNVADTDEIGTIEYGLAHVLTPVLVVLGHTQCGAVTAVTRSVQGEQLKLERNIPPLVDNIVPAVERAIATHSDAHGTEVVPYAIEENVWQAIRDLFLKSPASRDLVASGKVKVVGAIYDISSGEVSWLPEAKVGEILGEVNQSPEKVEGALAE
ncbi:MAG: carbonic anhydrase [Candidatus Hydrogenedentes bacterium]|nr:carbonic anhydrase [Candidatus Hydrogenedentota bacterium]